MRTLNLAKKWKVFFVLNKTFIYFKNNLKEIEKSFRLSFLMLLLIISPIAVFFGYSNLGSYFESYDFTLTDLYNLSYPGVAGLWLYILFSLIIHASLQGMVVLKFTEKGSSSFIHSLKYTMPRLPKLLGVSFIEMALAGVLFALYYGAKKMFNVDYLAFFFGILSFGIFFWFFIASSFASFVILTEDYGVLKSIKYSMSLIKGSWWSTFIYSAFVTFGIFFLDDLINLISDNYLTGIPLRDFGASFNLELELERIFALSIDLLANVIYLIYYIGLYFWYRYRKASYVHSSFLNLQLA